VPQIVPTWRDSRLSPVSLKESRQNTRQHGAIQGKRPGGQTFKIRFGNGESIEQGWSPSKYTFQAYMKKLPAMAEKGGWHPGNVILFSSLNYLKCVPKT
jgi:hypothetical protein